MSFDTLAPHYRWMERVLAGRKLQRCRTAFLHKISPPQSALLVGEGNGRFLEEFVHRFPNTRITCLDASANMLGEARRVTTPQASVDFIHANILEWNPPRDRFNLIVTNFFLDCFTPAQLHQVVAKLAFAARAKATWLLADFCEPSRGWKKWRARPILASMYLFFRFATRLPAKRLTPPDQPLAAHAFRLIAREYYDWDLLHADCWERGALE